jgi:hypothetical protein
LPLTQRRDVVQFARVVGCRRFAEPVEHGGHPSTGATPIAIGRGVCVIIARRTRPWAVIQSAPAALAVPASQTCFPLQPPRSCICHYVPLSRNPVSRALPTLTGPNLGRGATWADAASHSPNAARNGGRLSVGVLSDLLGPVPTWLVPNLTAHGERAVSDTGSVRHRSSGASGRGLAGPGRAPGPKRQPAAVRAATRQPLRRSRPGGGHAEGGTSR